MEPRGRLRKFLDRNNLTSRAFARTAGLLEANVSRYLSGDRVPGLAAAVAIERATKGLVKSSAWLKRATPRKRTA